MSQFLTPPPSHTHTHTDIHEASAPTSPYEENNFEVQFETLKEEYDKKHDAALTSSKTD